MLHKALLPDAQFKMTDAGSGSFGMYLSTWGNWDRVRPVPERPVKGAFLPYLDAFVKDGFIAYAHDWERIPIATVTAAHEDDYGLWVDAEFHSTAFAQEVRTTIKERQARGKSVKSSMGYDIADSRLVDMDDPALKAQGIERGLELLALPLYEGSIVNVPANPNADVSRAKALARGPAGAVLSQVKSLYDSQDMTAWEAQEILSVLLCYVRDGQLLQTADPAALMLVSNQLRAAAGVVLTLLTADTASGKAAGPVIRPPFALEVTHVEAAMRDLVTRAKARSAVRTKAGRTLSTATRTRLEDMQGALAAAVPQLQEVLADLGELLTGTADPPDADEAAAKAATDAVRRLYAQHLYTQTLGASHA